MPNLIVRTVNSAFYTESEIDIRKADDALSLGVRGALMIAADEINDGATASVVEVAVENLEGDLLHKVAVTVSVAALAIHSSLRKPLPIEGNDR